MKYHRFNLLLNHRQYLWLKAKAKNMGRSVASLIKEGIEIIMKKYRDV